MRSLNGAKGQGGIRLGMGRSRPGDGAGPTIMMLIMGMIGRKVPVRSVYENGTVR